MRAPKQYKEEERELQGDIEGRSFFKCCYTRRHQGDDLKSEIEEVDEEGYSSPLRKDKKDKAGCPTCKA